MEVREERDRWTTRILLKWDVESHLNDRVRKNDECRDIVSHRVFLAGALVQPTCCWLPCMWITP